MESVMVITHPIPPSNPSPSHLRPFNPPNFQHFPFKSLTTTTTTFICAASGNGDKDQQRGNSKVGSDNGSKEKENFQQPPRMMNMKWVDLLVNPDPDNVLAVGLTGVLAWASVQVLWQLFVISIAIVLAALKYSFIAALLIFILITLL